MTRNTTMRAAVFVERGKIELREVARPRLARVTY
jgi:hypothetical protein